MRTLLLATLVLCAAPRARAEEPAAPPASEAAAHILAVELRRGPAAALEPHLGPDAPVALRRLALRALGRIGEDDPAVAGLLARALADPPEDAETHGLLLWAAGISRLAAVGDALIAACRLPAPALRAQAAAALGWIEAPGAGEALGALLDAPEAEVRAGALVGLARRRDADAARGARVAGFLDDPDPRVRRAARLAGWMMAAGRKAAAARKEPAGPDAAPWPGEPAEARRWLALLDARDPEARLDGVRTVATLLPETAAALTGPFEALAELAADPDPRVVAEWLARLVRPRVAGLAPDGAAYRALGAALAHDDPKVRDLGAQVLGARADAAARAALAARLAVESDARVRETLVVELARCGDEAAWARLAEYGPRPADEVLRQLTDVRVALASPRAEALSELLAWADPGASQRTDLGGAAWLEVLGGLTGRKPPGLAGWLRGLLEGGYAIDPFDRPFVQAEALGLAAGAGLVELLPLVRARLGPPAHEEVRAGAARALGEFLGAAAGAEWADPVAAEVRAAATNDTSPWVRRAAREALKAAGLDAPAPVAPVNAWRGLPVAAGEGWLTEAEILEQAAWIERHDPIVALDTTQGTIHLRLDARWAPVHAVSLVQAVRRGVYAGTRWHRVVPSFVIQGGDPHGHGAGHAGWTVPDEIAPHPYRRGVLGMPKSTKDDGGCQLFVMHGDYGPLDERYTAYGRVVSGMEVVDRIRVGDRILRARLLPDPGAR